MRPFRRAKIVAGRRDVRLRAIQPHVTLALLLGVIKWMGVQEGPHKLAADVFQSEFKMRVLVDRVVAAEVSRRADHHPLLVGDFLRRDQAR